MRKLGELLPYVTYRSISGDTSEKVGGVACHSGKVGAHAVFVCIRGGRSDGHDYILEAVERGACVIVAEHRYVTWSRQGALVLTERRKVDLSELVKGKGICVVTADDTRKFLGNFGGFLRLSGEEAVCDRDHRDGRQDDNDVFNGGNPAGGGI